MHTHHTLDASDEACVVVDIGGDVGALVVVTEPEWHGREIEAVPAGRDQHPVHVAVRRRSSPGGDAYAAIFPALRAGEYRLRPVGGDVLTATTIMGGEVTQLDW